MGWKAKPLRTWIWSYDQGLVFQIESDSDTTINVYVDGATDPVAQINVVAGVNDYTVDISAAIPSNPDNAYHTVKLADDTTSVTFNFLYVAHSKTVNFTDENGNQITGQIALAEINKGTLNATSYGSTITIPDLTTLQNLGIDNKSYLEFLAIKDNKKYYVLIRLDKLLSYFEDSTVNLQIKGMDRLVIKVVMDYQVVSNNLPSWLSWLVPVADAFVDFSLWLGSQWINYDMLVARAIAKHLGIKLPIVKVEVHTDTNEFIIYFEQDANQLALVGIIAIAVAIGLIAVAFAIRDIAVVQTPFQPVAVASELDKQKLELIKKNQEYCQEHASTTEEYIRCITQGQRGITEAFGTMDTDTAIKLYYDYQNQKTEADKWKNIAIVVGIAAVVGALLWWRR